MELNKKKKNWTNHFFNLFFCFVNLLKNKLTKQKFCHYFLFFLKQMFGFGGFSQSV